MRPMQILSPRRRSLFGKRGRWLISHVGHNGRWKEAHYGAGPGGWQVLSVDLNRSPHRRVLLSYLRVIIGGLRLVGGLNDKFRGVPSVGKATL